MPLIFLLLMGFETSLHCSQTLFLALIRLTHFVGATPWNKCVHLPDSDMLYL